LFATYHLEVQLIYINKKSYNFLSPIEIILFIKKKNRLFGNSLFYQEEMGKTLRELEFEEGGIRLRLESGPVPNYGNIALKIKIDSKHLPGEPRKIDLVLNPGSSVVEL
jgi:hypothetical protein